MTWLNAAVWQLLRVTKVCELDVAAWDGLTLLQGFQQQNVLRLDAVQTSTGSVRAGDMVCGKHVLVLSWMAVSSSRGSRSRMFCALMLRTQAQTQ